MPDHPDVLIIGGGVIGLTTAYFLSQKGVSVTIVDKGDFGQEASWAGAGILPPGNPSKHQLPIEQLRAYSAVLFPGLSSELKELTGIDNGYVCSGGLDFPNGADDGLDSEWHGQGIPFERVKKRKLHRLEPALAFDLERAVFLPGMAQLRNPRHLKALLTACQLQSVRLRSGCPVMGLERQGARVVAVHTLVGTLTAEKIVLAAGAWSDSLLLSVGWQPGIYPVRGQIALLNTETPYLRRILVSGKRYIVPRGDGRILIGSTEEDAGFDKRTTTEAIQDLLAFAMKLVPPLGHASLERCWAGLRPGSPDGMPFIGLVPGCNNLYIAGGHFRAGIQLSPGTGMVLKELLLGQKPTVPLEAFRPDRIPVRRKAR